MLVRTFLTYKRNELERFRRWITDWEFREYFREVATTLRDSPAPVSGHAREAAPGYRLGGGKATPFGTVRHPERA